MKQKRFFHNGIFRPAVLMPAVMSGLSGCGVNTPEKAVN